MHTNNLILYFHNRGQHWMILKVPIIAIIKTIDIPYKVYTISFIHLLLNNSLE